MKTVEKVWGRELWITNSSLYCGKILLLDKDAWCSLHYHKKKDETFYILSGKVGFECEDKADIILVPGDTIHIPPNTKHRFSGIEESQIIEFSTHHSDKDSYRLEKSGRLNPK